MLLDLFQDIVVFIMGVDALVRTFVRALFATRSVVETSLTMF